MEGGRAPVIRRRSKSNPRRVQDIVLDLTGPIVSSWQFQDARGVDVEADDLKARPTERGRNRQTDMAQSQDRNTSPHASHYTTGPIDPGSRYPVKPGTRGINLTAPAKYIRHLSMNDKS